MDAMAAALRARDALMSHLIDWVRDEHAQVLDDAGAQTMLIRLLRGATGRSMSLIWALNDFRPDDGGPPLTARFAALPDLAPAERDIARGLAGSSLDVYRVRASTAGLGVELESLSCDERVELVGERGLGLLAVGDILVARVVRATSPTTLWGLAARFGPASERRWCARLATLPADPAEAALALLTFHPDDAAEPLPDGLRLCTRTWPIDDDDLVIEALEDDDAFECLGEALPSGWAFAWIDDRERGHPDLGGWTEDDDIEIARLVVCERKMTVVSADRDILLEVGSHVERRVRERITTAPVGQAA
jgi:hypothetical protein